MGILFGDFSGMSKPERKKDFWRRVLVDVIAWGVSWGMAAFVFGFILTFFYYGYEYFGAEGMMEEIGGAKSGVFTFLITSFLGALMFGGIALILGLIFGFISGAIDARMGGLIGISFGRAVGLGAVSAFFGLLYGILIVLVFGFLYLISGGTGVDLLDISGNSAESAELWGYIIVFVLLIIAVLIVGSLMGFLLGAISGIIAGIGNIFFKGKWRIFSEVAPAALSLTAIGLLFGISTASSTGRIFAIVIGGVSGAFSGVLLGLMIGLFRYVIPDRFINRANGEANEVPA